MEIDKNYIISCIIFIKTLAKAEYFLYNKYAYWGIAKR